MPTAPKPSTDDLARLETLIRQLQGMVPIRAEGSPEGVVTADVGRLYVRSDGGIGSTLYVKESGSSNTGWAAK